MGKSLIIGAMTNYEYEQVRPWVKSVNTCGFTGDKVMMVFNASYACVEEIVKEGFGVVAFGRDDKIQRFTHSSFKGMPIHVERFFSIWNYLQLNDLWKEYDYVITTDVKDVVFQSDPSEWLRKNLGNKKLVAGSESIRYMDEPWGNQNLLECYGPYFYEKFKENEIYNVGTLGGTAEYMKDLCMHIFQNALNRPIPIVDQAVFNVLIQTQPFKDVVKFCEQWLGWALQAGTTVDPSKIEQFRPHLLEGEPVWSPIEAAAWTNGKGKKFCILHQYDRVPEWKKAVEAKYS